MLINLVDFVKENVFSNFNSDEFNEDELTEENAIKLIKLSILINGKKIKELPKEVKDKIKVKTINAGKGPVDLDDSVWIRHSDFNIRTDNGEIVDLDDSIWTRHSDFDVMPTAELDADEKYFNDLSKIITYSAEDCDDIKPELKLYKENFESEFLHEDILEVRNIMEEMNFGILDFFEGNATLLKEVINSDGDFSLCDFVDTNNAYIKTIFNNLSDTSQQNIEKYAEQINYLSELLGYRKEQGMYIIF